LLTGDHLPKGRPLLLRKRRLLYEGRRACAAVLLRLLLVVLLLLRACARLPVLRARCWPLLERRLAVLHRRLVLRRHLRVMLLLWREARMRRRRQHALLLLGRWRNKLLLLVLLWRLIGRGSRTCAHLYPCRRRHAEAGLRPSGSRREAGLRVQGRRLIRGHRRSRLLSWDLCLRTPMCTMVTIAASILAGIDMLASALSGREARNNSWLIIWDPPAIGGAQRWGNMLQLLPA